MKLSTCVAPEGRFGYGIHRPVFRVANLRRDDPALELGCTPKGGRLDNRANLPAGDVEEPAADWIYEVANPFPFRGATFIVKRWADQRALAPEAIRLPAVSDVSLTRAAAQWAAAPEAVEKLQARVFETLPRPLRLALAATATDPRDLIRLARGCCRFVETEGAPVGLMYEPDAHGGWRPAVTDHELFETLANNPALPDRYKEIMVLRPGVQGNNEITADWRSPNRQTRIYEYLRRNSYIPWGHYAANLAEDCVRYRIADLTAADITGLRHLYYQRTFVRLAEQAGIPVDIRRRPLTVDELETLRHRVLDTLPQRSLPFDGTLWGWNFGFDFTPSGYRLHGSHQQVHQQYALIPGGVDTAPSSSTEALRPYACGDLVRRFIREYRRETGRGFFECYIEAIDTNQRLDGRSEGDRQLVVYADANVMLFVPKAQTSQWELQLISLPPVGNILEADAGLRRSLDRAILVAVKVLGAMGARMISSIEYAKRFSDSDTDQHLLYVFLPKLPESPGAFTEAQLRWISGHYPEDFAAACRSHLEAVPAETAAMDG
ncbi:MAG: hypothetical protein RBR20_01840 [Desulfobacterales bacterium]|jgi:hypothetical protein|nr:hypothetical protein [Desulfobacteraceae bacterium]MDD3991990.1 hypothetical protein [Desulfobacteraceae bacterium]MDY0310842.1 hypothetical protein [Desulfobacterales bacterium]